MFQSAFSDLDLARKNSPPTSTTIPARCKILNLPWQADDVPNSSGARIHWIGDRSAKKVIFYIHGGGYGLSAFDGHVIFLAQCQEKLAAKGDGVVIAMLEYSLTKMVKYPTEFIQGVEAFRYILANGYKPGNIVIGGDSCGGNLAIAIMSIIAHPRPTFRPLSLSGPLAGVLLVSPWVSFSSDAQSFKDNKTKDIHMAPQMHEWARDFCTETERDNYTEPILANVGWWKGLQAKQILVLSGTYEIFLTDIRKFAQTLKEAGLNVTYVDCEMQVHIDCILDAQSGLEPGDMSHATWEWLERVY
ncbi:alpha/beta-hydrolase [Lepidopterella palustris CBS 459.81]|uniref:Alpha/beta-hydrolase n=1 Tax=Lepidopterella palustris CBS 459.81 TaxID=1314670 RepID=A0A8E2E794_9PEZI|nr:alpha/beta-hydrolase [Lepidopterella palustris CBS 459.81]